MAESIDIAKEIEGIEDPKALRVIIIHLLEEIKLLKEKVSRLEKNSSNSSKPPSSDIVKPKDQQRQPGVRKAGGQMKHAGFKHKLKPKSEVDDFREYKVSKCPDCGGAVEATGKKKILQQYEFQAKPIILTEHTCQESECKNCNKKYYGELPQEVVESQSCGVNLQSFIHYCKSVTGMSYKDLKEMLKDVFQVQLSSGTICNIIKNGSKSLAEPYKELHEKLLKQPNLNIDETGWYENGYNRWCWNFCNKQITYFAIRNSRGSKVVEEILGSGFKGATTTDFYNAYNKYNNHDHQFCLAHLIRDIKFLTTLPDEVHRQFGEKLLGFFRRIFYVWNGCFADKVPRLKKITKRLYNYLARIKVTGIAKTLQKRIFKRWKNLFRFIDEPELYSPTNNEAERTLRFVTRIRKMTLGSRSSWGMQWAQRSLSIISTCRKQKTSIYYFLQQAFRNLYFNTPYSSELLDT